MASDYDRLRQAHREALEKAQAPEAQPTRPSDENMIKPGVGPAPDMVRNQDWANNYNKKVQDHQAQLHAVQQDKEEPEASTKTPESKPSEQDHIDARKALAADHQAAIKKPEQPAQEQDSETVVEDDKPKEGIEKYRQAETKDAAAEKSQANQEQGINRFRRDPSDDRGQSR